MVLCINVFFLESASLKVLDKSHEIFLVNQVMNRKFTANFFPYILDCYLDALILLEIARYQVLSCQLSNFILFSTSYNLLRYQPL